MGQKRSGSLLILTLNQEGYSCTWHRNLLAPDNNWPPESLALEGSVLFNYIN